MGVLGNCLRALGESFRVKQALVFLSILFVASCFGQSSAGQSSSAGTARPRHRAMPGGERSMKGCITKDENGNYLLTPPRGVQVKLNNSDDVAKHLGQQVRLSGAFVDAPEPSTSSPAAESQPASKSRVVREFHVVKVDVVSQTCSSPPSKKK